MSRSLLVVLQAASIASVSIFHRRGPRHEQRANCCFRDRYRNPERGSGRVGKIVLSFGPLVLVGQIGFSIYLLHLFGLHWAAALGFQGNTQVLIGLIATLCLATVGYLFVEQPGQKLGKVLVTILRGRIVPVGLPVQRDIAGE
jgi:peptidoglycan/LPS O-acetylase OafA/YrhL